MVSPVTETETVCEGLRGDCVARNTTPRYSLANWRKLVSTRPGNFPRALTCDLRGDNTTWNPDEEIRAALPAVTYDNLHLPRTALRRRRCRICCEKRDESRVDERGITSKSRNWRVHTLTFSSISSTRSALAIAYYIPRSREEISDSADLAKSSKTHFETLKRKNYSATCDQYYIWYRKILWQ